MWRVGNNRTGDRIIDRIGLVKKRMLAVRAILVLVVCAVILNCEAAKSADASVKQIKPMIGINLDLSEDSKEASVPTYYFEAVEKSGGIPVLLPPMPTDDIPAALSKLDGLLLIGGDDYPPSLYGESPEPKTSVMAKRRSDFDIALVKAAMSVPNLPILGICAGCQVLNINAGGSLVQDIPSHHPESNIVHGGPYDAKIGPHKHRVTFEKGSFLAKIYSEPSISVPTSHHQCVGKVGQELHVAAQSEDGLPEAIEKSGGRFVVGVQWHPERDFENNKQLFAEFLSSASKAIR